MVVAANNPWNEVRVPGLGGWRPSRTVTVVVPFYDNRREFAVTLEFLGRQTYPSDLFEVVVADDGSSPPLDVDELDTELEVRVVRQEDLGFRLAAARNLGAAAADGEVLLFLDADMVPVPTWMEAHLRWHHEREDAVTLGFRRHAPVERFAGLGDDPSAWSIESMLEDAERPEWIEFHMSRTRDLTSGDPDLFRVVTGGNLGISAERFRDVGGFDERFVRWGGEDTELGYRLYTAGMLLVPERQALCVHQGTGATPDPEERQSQAVQRHLLGQLIPTGDFRPASPGRQYVVPRLVVRLRADGDGAIPVIAELLAWSDDVGIVVEGEVSDSLAIAYAGDARVALGDPPDAWAWSMFVAVLEGSEPLPDDPEGLLGRAWGTAGSRFGPLTVASRRHAALAPPAPLARTAPSDAVWRRRVARIRSFDDVARAARWAGAAATHRLRRRRSDPLGSRRLRTASRLGSTSEVVGLGGVPEDPDLVVTTDRAVAEGQDERVWRVVDRPSPVLFVPPLSPSELMALTGPDDPRSLLAADRAEQLEHDLGLREPDAVPPDFVVRAASARWRREVLTAHLPEGRVGSAAADSGFEPWPLVDVLLATRRPDRVRTALEMLAGQDYPRFRVVVAAHGFDARATSFEEGSLDVRWLALASDALFGDVLRRASDESGGELVAKVDDDDRYGPAHLRDLVVAHLATGAELVGKGAEFVHLAGSDATAHRPIDPYVDSTTIAGGALLVSRSALLEVGGWRRIARGVDQALIRDVRRSGGRAYRTHGFGFVLERSAGGHTWEQDDRYFRDQADQVLQGPADWVLAV